MRHGRIAGGFAIMATVLCCLAVGSLTVCAPRIYAAQGFVAPLPAPPRASTCGISLRLDCLSLDGPGYHPVKLTFTCTPSSPRDRLLSVELTTRSRAEVRPVTVTAPVEISTGTTSVTKVIPLPHLSTGYNLSITVRENGYKLDDLSAEDFNMLTSTTGLNVAPGMLFVGAAPPDITTLYMVFENPQVQNYPPGTNVPNLPSQPAQISKFGQATTADLWEDWINYCGTDVVFISFDDLKDVSQSRAKAWQALRSWARAGGNLCVYGAGDDWHALAELEEILSLPPLQDADKGPRRGWAEPAGATFGVTVNADGSTVVQAKPNAPGASTPPTPPMKAPFVWRNHGMGLVLAIAAEKPFPGTIDEWRWLLNSIGANRYSWPTRHGLSPQGGNPGFDDFLISDIGLPPVRTYRVLITLFVVAIGPLNYWLLRRAGRLHLLLFTVPAAAALVSGALLAFAVVGDGFDTYVRARSYTELDQRRHEAVTWSRLSYYAGLAPADGLTFPGDTAVLPIDREAMWNGGGLPLRELDWSDGQHLSRGWLASRTPTQFLTVRPHSTQRELRIVEPSEPGKCLVENRLNTKIRRLLLRDANRQLFAGKDLAAGAKVELQAMIADSQVAEAVGSLVAERNRDMPALPRDVTTSVARIFFGGRRSMHRGYREFNGTTSSSLLEQSIAAAGDLAGNRLPEPRTYLAVVDRPEDVVLGIDDPLESQSMHLILGNW